MRREKRKIGIRDHSNISDSKIRRLKRRRMELLIKMGAAAVGLLLIIIFVVLAAKSCGKEKEVQPVVKKTEDNKSVQPIEAVKKKLVAIDAGHGGVDPGSDSNNVYEKDVNFSVAQKLDSLLKQNGFDTYMVRPEDKKVSKYDRANNSNQKKADLFISIHCNYLNPKSGSADGIETYYDKNKQTSQKLAQDIQDEVIKATGARDRGARDQDYVVIRDTTMPAALIEIGFLTDSGERQMLVSDDYQNLLAQGMCQGIMSFLK